MKYILLKLIGIIYHLLMVIFAWSPKIKKMIFLVYFNLKNILR